MHNAAHLLLAREVGGTPRCTPKDGRSNAARLQQWAEASLTSHCSASYATFQPPPRSTIALSYNCDGTLLASTHGDHTVKLSSCASGKLVRVLTGHRRTPWVVRFHLRKPNLLASGSLDHEVRLWDANTGQCIARHTFGKPIASLAFHVSLDVLAIGCGHKLYMWEYSAQGKLPVIVLKTRRSMRAVHFHPQGLPIVLTAEVQDPSATPDLPATLTEDGPYMQRQQQQQRQPHAAQHRGLAPGLRAAQRQHAAVHAAQPNPARAEGGPAAAVAAEQMTPPGSGEVPIPSAQLLWNMAGSNTPQTSAAGVYVATAAGPVPVHQFAAAAAAASSAPQHALDQPPAALGGPLHPLHAGAGLHAHSQNPRPATAVAAGPVPSNSSSVGGGGQQQQQQQQQGGSTSADRPAVPGWVPPGSAQLPPSMVPTGWELPFPSNLFAGAQAPQPAVGTGLGGGPAAAAGGWAATAASLPQVMAAFSAAAWNIIGEEQPPRVRLRIWHFDAAKPTALLAVLGAERGSGNLKLQVSDAVLCSEMGVHFSSCGRFLAGTTACRGPLPAAVTTGGLLGEDDGDAPSQQEVDAALAAALGGNTARAEALLSRRALVGPMPDAPRGSAALRAAGASASAFLQRGSSPGGAAGPAAAAVEAAAAAAAAAAATQQRPERVVFEVRVYSIDGPDFGQVVRAKRIRAAHCLTSVQFSPCCDHMLLAYGKKHISLLRSLVADRGSVVPLHTILEVVRLKDMALVRVLPSADDEINAACFNPQPGGGVAYGTKEGRLRVIAHDRSQLSEDEAPSSREAGSGGQAGGGSVGGAEHPTQRELDQLREFVLTQQWLRQQALGDGPRAGAAAAPGNAAAAGAAHQLQAMQQLWEQGGRAE